MAAGDRRRIGACCGCCAGRHADAARLHRARGARRSGGDAVRKGRRQRRAAVRGAVRQRRIGQRGSRQSLQKLRARAATPRRYRPGASLRAYGSRRRCQRAAQARPHPHRPDHQGPAMVRSDAAPRPRAIPAAGACGRAAQQRPRRGLCGKPAGRLAHPVEPRRCRRSRAAARSVPSPI
jgi:hypothetical protein